MPHAEPHQRPASMAACGLALALLGGLALAALLPGAADAQSGGGYDLSWNTSRCGGGAASAGAYDLVSTLGIAEGGLITGGAYALNGGFLVGASTSLAGVAPGAGGLPMAFALHSPAPNPFAGATRLDYDVPKPAHVQLAIYDVSGRLVRGLVQGSLPAGRHQAFWDGRSDAGLLAAPGVYLVRFESPTFRATRRVVHLN